jgi:hypothetical protein
MSRSVGIHFGALCAPIVQQLLEQEVTAIPDNINQLQDYANSITMLYIHGILTELETHNARKRLMKKIHKALGETIKKEKSNECKD